MISSKAIQEENTVDKVSCGICKRQLSRYTCPTCNVPYCSLTCFRSPSHGDCTERFYKREIELDIKGDQTKNIQERQKMMEILKRFEEEDGMEDEEEEEDSDDEENSLSNRLKDVDLDSPDVLWTLLSPAERSSFLKTIQDPTSSLALTRQAVESSIEPWWTADADDDPGGVLIGPSRKRQIGAKPDMMSIPDSLIPKVPSKSLLIYNIVAIILAYAYTTRVTSSPLSTLSGHRSGKAGSEYDYGLETLHTIVPFLFDRRTKQGYGSIEEVVVDTWARIPNIERGMFKVLLEDCITLLRPTLVTEESKSPHERLLLVLSDLHGFLSRREKPVHRQLKIQFYAAQVSSRGFEVDGVRYVAGELEMEKRKYE